MVSYSEEGSFQLSTMLFQIERRRGIESSYSSFKSGQVESSIVNQLRRQHFFMHPQRLKEFHLAFALGLGLLQVLLLALYGTGLGHLILA